jgi:hypothetical protein
MTDEVEHECVICGAPATNHAVPSRNVLTRQWTDDDGSVKTEHQRLPLFHLCANDMRGMIQHKFQFGWCDDPACRRWGKRGDVSPCGSPYVELPSRVGR